MRRLALALAALLALPAALAQQPSETERRAALLVYRQALHPEGERIAATAAVLAERVAAPGRVDLGTVRDQLMERLGSGAETAAWPVRPGPADAVASHLSRALGRQGGEPGSGLLPAWRVVEAGGEPAGLAAALRTFAANAAGDIWHGALTAMGDDSGLAQALAPLIAELAGEPGATLAAWRQRPPALPEQALAVMSDEDWVAALDAATEAAIATPEEVSAERAARWRAQGWLMQRHGDFAGERAMVDALKLALIERLRPFADGNPMPLMTALLDGVIALSLEEELSGPARSELGHLLESLESLPMRYDVQWREVDLRLPEIYAEILDRMGQLISGEEGLPSMRALSALQARLSLVDDDWDAYLAQPFREPVQQALADCFGGGRADAAGCRNRFRDWALEGASIPEASGDSKGPFDSEYMLRELELNAWQRINYLRGYWREATGRDCSTRERVGNALEWSLGARAYLALAEAAVDDRPGGVASDLDALIRGGTALAVELENYADCRRRDNATLLVAMDIYRNALDRLARALPEAAEAFREAVLVEGADVSLDRGAGQGTDYAPDALEIPTCEGVASCGVSQSLPGSRALFERFPAPYRIAHQAGLGTLSLCYSDVSWVDRSVVPRSVGGQMMADFRGRLGFRVKGRYREGGEERDVFVLRLVGEGEYSYLYAPNRPEILADPCPQEYQGLRASGSLPENRAWLVPRRLTFLSAERTAPGRLFTENWLRGERWLERLAEAGRVTVEKSPGDPTELRARIDLHMASLRERRGQALFEHLARTGRPVAGEGATARLTRAARNLAAARRALDATTRVLLPQSAAMDPGLRRGLYGAEAIAGPRMIQEWRAAGRDPLEFPAAARERLVRHRPAWRESTGRSELPGFIARPLVRLLQARAKLEEEQAVNGTDVAGAMQPP